MSMNQTITGIMHAANEEILRSLQHFDSQWVSVEDIDGNPDLPDDEREVLVFLSGDKESSSDPRQEDAGYGLRQGYYDHSKRFWRVHGSKEWYVTHWMETPPKPKVAATSSERSSDK